MLLASGSGLGSSEVSEEDCSRFEADAEDGMGTLDRLQSRLGLCGRGEWLSALGSKG